jgi:signal transduction histidine kinase
LALSEVLPALGGVVVERLDGGLFAVRSALPGWLSELRRSGMSADAPFVLEDVFPFLGVFLPAAEEVWKRAPPARADSDFWTETDRNGNDVHLEATAMRVDERPLLVVMRNERLFQGGQSVLQRARELRITHDALMSELEQKDILVHAIVHDLAAPLHSIMGVLSLLAERELAAPASDWLRLGLQAAGRQRDLISEILDVFVAENAARPSSRVTDGVDLAEVVYEVIGEFTPVARGRDVRIEAGLEAGPSRVVAERTRLFRVLSNLVDNALRYSPSGGVVHVSLAPQGAFIEASVEDQGRGVAPEALPRLFEKLARGPDGGTGLGLFFCRITLESWGGGIGYERGQLGGARFWIQLQRMNEDGQAAPSR